MQWVENSNVKPNSLVKKDYCEVESELYLLEVDTQCLKMLPQENGLGT